MKLIVDFDNVLFKTQELKNLLFQILYKHTILNVEELYEKERGKENPFSLKHFLHTVCEGRDTNLDSVLYEEVMSACKSKINEEILGLLESVGYENCYIVTNGDEEFQKDKIFRSGISTLLSKIVVVPGSKKEEIARICMEFPGEDIIFVDDKEKFFMDINMEVCKNLTTVLYNEKGFENLKAEIIKSKESDRKI